MSATKKLPPHIRAGFGERFREARYDAGMSQAEVARLAGVSKRQVSEWERGRAFPNLGEQIRKVADVLRVPLSWLLRGEEND